MTAIKNNTEKVENALKNALYTGVGLAANTAEKVQTTVKELVEKGKAPSAEGKKIVEKFVKKSEGKTSEVESKTKELVESLISKLDFTHKKEIEDLTRKVAKLEAELKKLKGEAEKTAATKK